MSIDFFSGEYGQEIFQSLFHKYPLTMTRSRSGDTYTLSGGWEEVYEARTEMEKYCNHEQPLPKGCTLQNDECIAEFPGTSKSTSKGVLTYHNKAAASHCDTKEKLFPDIFGLVNLTSREKCSICLEYTEDAQSLKKCRHVFCRGCFSEALSHKPVCPICGEIYGALRGNQPDGNMLVHKDKKLKLSGYKNGSIVIDYILPGGMQTEQHPNPGKAYGSLQRFAYLPENKEGDEILGLLRRAFDARLVFTIGRSVTTGKEGVITWNDIHHKTTPDGKFGYPDETYLSRVREELAAKGIK